MMMMTMKMMLPYQRIRGERLFRSGRWYDDCNRATVAAALSPSQFGDYYYNTRSQSTANEPTTKSPNNTNHHSETTTTTTTANDDVLICAETVKYKYHRHLIRPGGQILSPRRTVPPHIRAPEYATTGGTISNSSSSSRSSSSSSPKHLPPPPQHHPMSTKIPIYTSPADDEFLQHMRRAGQIAATTLRIACDFAQRLRPAVTTTSIDDDDHHPVVYHHNNQTTTDDIDALVHDTMIQQFQTYPSPLNYATFPKSVCTSVNEIICHGIPERSRPLHYGDVLSIDVSGYTSDGVHGDNCATVIVGDYNDDDDDNHRTTATPSASSTIPIFHPSSPPQCDWRNVPYRTRFATDACREHFQQARRLMWATHEACRAAIAVIRPQVTTLAQVGQACQRVAHSYGYSSVTKYRGHGIGTEFHCAPFIKHYHNDEEQDEEDSIVIQEGMIFTIEPMLCQHRNDCTEWESDHWTVTTLDAGLSCQFEHTVLITKTGAEILTLPLGHANIGRDYVEE